MNPLHIHCFQHVAFEGPGYIETWAKQNGHHLTATRFYLGESSPGAFDFDWLIVMGGPMGVYDDTEFSWLVEEKEYIKKVIDAGKTVIGICLGAQLIAAVLGAKVYKNDKKEIGWFPLRKVPAAGRHCLLTELPGTFTAFHWHGDTFDLPRGAIHLLQNYACLNQAFLYNNKVLGLQFHLEVTPKTLSAMIENCGQELIPQQYVQTEQEILKGISLCENSNNLLKKIFNALAPV